MKRLVMATGNPGKVREIRQILGNYYDEILSLRDIGLKVDIVEDADTFHGNALKKAVTISKLVDCDVVADDSGLSVVGLDGRPGVYSARYSESGTDEDNNKKLVEEVTPLDEEGRKAYYTCDIVLARNGEEVCFAEGKCYGVIITEPRGNNGFGYDPYFYLPEYGQTFGELDPDEKNRISHRAKALMELERKVNEAHNNI